MKKWLLAGLLVLASVVVLTGCSGSGSIPSLYSTASGKATFGFTYDGFKGRLQGTFRDGNVQLSFQGPDSSSLNSSCIDTYVTYRSTNPSSRGQTGTAYIYACDDGEGHYAGDNLYIRIDSGPFSGYENSGAVEGNIQVK
jgi:hypothetical protein